MARTAVVAGTATAVSGRVQRRQQQRWAAQEQQQYYEQATQPPQAAPAEDDTTEQLVQLARLRDQGILTEEEFAAKKRQILGI